jgi:dihydrofolate reductase
MSRVFCQQGISLDGYTAGPNQSLENPLGEGGLRLHEWMFASRAWQDAHGNPSGQPTGDQGAPTPDDEVVSKLTQGIGAYVMGRNMFDAGRGEWDLSWRGWWGEDPPYHAPTFVLTHYPRDPLPMEGGTTFHFVTDGVESALAQARAAAGDLDVCVAGGANTVRQILRAGQLDELYLHVAPVLLGSGERLLDDVGDVSFDPIEVVASPMVTHVRYRVRR